MYLLPGGKVLPMARKDKRGRNLRMGESVRQDGRYQYRYTENGKTKFVYSWKLEETVYNKLYREQLPRITTHVCRHTYCSNMARAGMNPKTLQYLMGHSDIGVTMNTYTHLGLDDAELEMKRLEAQKKTIKDIEEERGVLLKFEA